MEIKKTNLQIIVVELVHESGSRIKKGQRKKCLAIKGLRSIILLHCKGLLAVSLSLEIKVS